MIDIPTLQLQRDATGDDGTFGRLLAAAGSGHRQHVAYSAEQPWRNNAPFESCIPAGKYLLARDYSPKWKRRYHVLDVPNRWAVLFHWGNFAGDEQLGKKSNLKGCIAPRLKLGVLDEQRVVLSSRVALGRLEEYLDAVGGYAWLEVSWLVSPAGDDGGRAA